MTITSASLLMRDPGVTVVTAPYGPRGPIIAGTSSTNTTIVLGPVVFEINEYGVGFATGMRLRASATGAPTQWMEGVCTSYGDQNLALTVDLIGGSGSYSDWTINVAGEQGQQGIQGPAGPASFADAPSDGNKYARLNAGWSSLAPDLAALQPLDADLTSLAGASGTNTIYYRSGAGVWSPVTIGSGIGFAGGTITSSAGGGNVSNSGTPVAGQVAVWTGTQNIQGLETNVHHGRLDYVSATQLKFAPYGGALIKINGLFFPIPSAGIAGLGNTSVFVNGTSGQNLAANTTYWVFAFNNGGTVTADFRTAATHATSTATGNLGTEILTANETRTLIGLVRTNASSQFQNDTANRLVLSWFNRRSLDMGNSAAFTGTVSSSTPTEISPTTARLNFVSWANEASLTFLGGTASNNTLGAITNANLYLDGSTQAFPHGAGSQHYANNSSVNLAGTGAVTPSEGYHYLTLFGWTNGTGTSTFNAQIGGVIRG